MVRLITLPVLHAWAASIVLIEGPLHTHPAFYKDHTQKRCVAASIAVTKHCTTFTHLSLTYPHKSQPVVPFFLIHVMIADFRQDSESCHHQHLGLMHSLAIPQVSPIVTIVQPASASLSLFYLPRHLMDKQPNTLLILFVFAMKPHSSHDGT